MLRAFALACVRVCVLAFALVGCSPSPSGDLRPGACDPAVHAWARRCSGGGVRVEAFQCPAPGLVVVDAAGLRVELTREPGRGFRRAGAWGVSPVGEFSDWNAVAAPLRAAFERVVACAASAPSLPASSGVASGVVPRSPHRSGHAVFHAQAPPWWRCVPWLLLGALACGLVARGRRGAPLRKTRMTARWRAWGLVAGLGAAVLAARAAVSPSAFFHMNGHGPSWIAHTVTGQHHPYGSGYRELFGWIIRLAPSHPEAAVFGLQSLLGAAGVAGAWVIARAMGASRVVSLAVAFAVTLDPVLARASRSESHYAAQTSLLLLAAAILARAVGPLRSRRFVLACVCAGLVLAQAMRTHPVAWVAAAVVPLVMFIGPGSPKRRAKRALAGFAITGAVTAVFALPTVLAVMRDGLGAQWAPRSAGSLVNAALRGALPAWMLGAAVAFLVGNPRRALPRVVALGIVFAALGGANVLAPGGVPPWVSGAYARLYAPVIVAVGAWFLASTRARPLAVAAGVAVGALALVLVRGPALTRLPTDALEQRHALAWRARLPDGARVVYLERARDHILVLPLYPGLTPRSVRPVPLRADEPAPSLTGFGAATYWYCSSVCSTRAGAAYCAAVERDNALTPVWTASLPARLSAPYLFYATAPVRVGLYRLSAR